jgi:hypothetical protein
LNPQIKVRSFYLDPSNLLYYEDQSNDPSFHSYRSPTVKIHKNVIIVIIIATEFVNSIIRGIGMRRTISISNTIKIIANKKNRVENGIRAALLGSNPHSNGEDFSRSTIDRDDKIKAVIRTAIGSNMAISVNIKARFIN